MVVAAVVVLMVLMGVLQVLEVPVEVVMEELVLVLL